MASRASRFVVRIRRTERYPVEIGEGLLERVGEALRNGLAVSRVAVLTDSRVEALHARPLLRSLARAGLDARVVAVPPGERSKSLPTLERVLARMHRLGVDRRTTLLCLGGGVICDLGGFAASAYMRGVPYVNLPTTLVAQLDAALGGKVAVNTPEAKNLIGAFHQPRAVLIDPSLLRTLPPRDLRAGFGEGIKVAILGSRPLFERIEGDREALLGRDADALAWTIGEAARVKMRLVEADPYEADLRRALNLGHAIAHALETDRHYRGIRHGEAVAFGIATTTELARRRGLVAAADAERILSLLEAYRLPTHLARLEVPSLLRRLRSIRMVRGGRLLFVVPAGIGRVTILEDVKDAELGSALAARRGRGRR
ncbi:MAG TPA: 3-dehydroquinate synthase [Planctomycetota bacterium]|jgi:3-dehydroquinate synthase|nr:3-dehydroquinate synthase [Planctomycetota bacterium]